MHYSYVVGYILHADISMRSLTLHTYVYVWATEGASNPILVARVLINTQIWFLFSLQREGYICH